MLRPCSFPGCPRLSPHSYCELHARQTSRQRGKTNERGYDWDHRRLRVLCFQRDNWTCVDCGWQPEFVAMHAHFHMGPPKVEQVLAELRQRYHRGDRHLHADHVIPIEERPDLRLDLDNLATRCDRCHNARTMRETRASLPQARPSRR